MLLLAFTSIPFVRNVINKYLDQSEDEIYKHCTSGVVSIEVPFPQNFNKEQAMVDFERAKYYLKRSCSTAHSTKSNINKRFQFTRDPCYLDDLLEDKKYDFPSIHDSASLKQVLNEPFNLDTSNTTTEDTCISNNICCKTKSIIVGQDSDSGIDNIRVHGLNDLSFSILMETRSDILPKSACQSLMKEESIHYCTSNLEHYEEQVANEVLDSIEHNESKTQEINSECCSILKEMIDLLVHSCEQDSAGYENTCCKSSDKHDSVTLFGYENTCSKSSGKQDSVTLSGYENTGCKLSDKQDSVTLSGYENTCSKSSGKQDSVTLSGYENTGCKSSDKQDSVTLSGYENTGCESGKAKNLLVENTDRHALHSRPRPKDNRYFPTKDFKAKLTVKPGKPRYPKRVPFYNKTSIESFITKKEYPPRIQPKVFYCGNLKLDKETPLSLKGKKKFNVEGKVIKKQCCGRIAPQSQTYLQLHMHRSKTPPLKKSQSLSLKPSTI